MFDIRKVDVDDVLTSLGSVGSFQILQYWFSTLTYFTGAYHVLCIIFIAKSNPQTCAPPPGLAVNQSDDVYGKCTINHNNGTNITSCIYGYSYEKPKDISIVSDFELVCERAALSDFSQTMLNLGMAVGAMTLTLASDRFGRKPVCVLSHLGCLITGIAVSFAPNYTVFAIMKFANGIVQQGTILTAVTFAIEIFPKEKRKFVGFFGLLMWSFCVASMAPIAYGVRMFSWRIVSLVLTVPSLYSLLQYWVTDESIRWLIANNRIQDTTRLVKKAARMNNVNANEPLKHLYQQEMETVESDKHTEKLLAVTLETETDKKVQEEKKYTIFDIFKRKRLAGSLIIIWFMWFTNSMTYYGIYLTSSTLAGNMYINFFLNALIEAPSAVVFWFTIDTIGRKKTAILFHGIAAFGLISATILRLYDDDDAIATTATVFSLIGKFGISGSFNVIFVYTPEVFPTNVRNVTYGSASAAARIGGMLAPFSSLLAVTMVWAPGAIFGGCCLVTAGLIFFLPETMGKELPQTMEDVSKLYEK